MTLAERKAAELERKLASLDEEFRRWEDAIDAGGEFQRYQSQIRGVLLPLRALRNRIATDLQKASGDQYLAEAAKATQLILGVHRIWEFFRQKLAQRMDARLRGFLEIADEFAWLCYAPVLKKTKFRRPPLVYLNGGDSPFILRRNERFQLDGRAVGDPDFERILGRLPFPVIGIPWHELEYWPEMVAIGHEVGHAVERDLKLEPLLDKAILTALGKDASRARYWKAWRSELFADAYGCAATGPAFASGLGDFLANSASMLESEAPSAQSDYPPTLLRLIFNQDVLKTAGLDAEIPGWNFNDPGGRLRPFLPEAAAIAKAFAGPRGPLRKLLTFSPEQWKAARKRASDSAARRKPDKAQKDLRVLVAAIRCAFQASPEDWDRSTDRLPTPLAQIQADITPLIKAETRAGLKPDREKQDRADLGSADAIYETLSEYVRKLNGRRDRR